MIENWRCLQRWLYDCDTPTIHHVSLSCMFVYLLLVGKIVDLLAL